MRGFEVAEEAGEGGFESVVGFPVGEIGDEIFADFDGQVFADTGDCHMIVPITKVVGYRPSIARRSGRGQVRGLMDVKP